jgi:hypothetical protein
MISRLVQSRNLASLSPPHMVSGPATDEEYDGEKAERESLPGAGTSRLPCSPGPIPRSRAARLLIEAPPRSAIGASPHSASPPAILSHSPRWHLRLRAGSLQDRRRASRVPNTRSQSCRVHTPAPEAGLCAQPAWRAEPGLEEKTFREVRIDSRTRLEAWNMAGSRGRRG